PLINNSKKDLEIDGLNVLNTAIPTVTIDVENDAAFAFAIAYSFGPSLIQILNQGGPGAPGVLLQGPINNPIGETRITNARGDIVSTSAQTVVRTNVLRAEATLANIGSPA